ncbi:receptor-like protein EIX2 [Aristolochia californica]|uniref:receptor-like protein EIX2 n=1 Tax=Aristolochia californica TaxID=171875 RepID=UPI0035DEE8FD
MTKGISLHPPQISHLSSLQVLDLGNFTARTVVRKSKYYRFGNSTEKLPITLIGFVLGYTRKLGLLNLIDLTANDLFGNIPEQLTHLIGLVSLNLSRNRLTGKTPSKIGAIHALESSDLSQNKLSGEIPSSLSMLNFLNWLNLRNNNLSGRILTVSRLQTLHDSSTYAGNDKLLGPPFTEKCPGAKRLVVKEKEEEAIDWSFESMELGFINGFWVFCRALILRKSWRNAHYQFAYDLINQGLVDMDLQS